MAARRSPLERARRAGRRLIGLAAGLWLTAGALDAGRAALDRWIDATPIHDLAIATGTEVLARDGSLLRAFQVGDGIWRLTPPDAGVDPRFLAMLTLWEDRRFAEHPGIDLRAVARAAAQAVWHRRIVSGASILSMQTARLLERGPTADWHGKLRQVRLALALERRIGKDGIMALYLRLAPYGGNTEGVRAASLMWFGKEPARLTPAEAALLVALPQAPESRRPDLPTRRAAARAARNRVIGRAQAADPLDAEAADTARAVARQPDSVSAAAIIADHTTGEVLVEVGTASFGATPSSGFIDMTRAPRSPGSALKPFVYALSFDDGLFHPETLIEDTPAVFGRWQPENFDRHFPGTVTIRRALVESLNIPVVRVAAAPGPARVMAGLRRAG